MRAYAEPVKKLIEEFEKLPGVGKRTAERFAFHILNSGKDSASELAGAITEVINNIARCSLCCNLTDKNPCGICSSAGRDKTQVCVVEQPADVAAIERTGNFRGLYHVLMGALSPLKGIGPGALNIGPLVSRVVEEGVEEVILATDPDYEGDATAQYISDILRPSGVRITRIATGLPAGSTLEFAGEATLRKAIEGRRSQD